VSVQWNPLIRSLGRDLRGLLWGAVRRLLVPSAAALNDRIVSSGRSRRLRVGFERSGSASVDVSNMCRPMASDTRLTDDITVRILIPQ